MAKVEGLNLRGSRYYVRVLIPDDLKAAFGKHRVNLSLGTSDRREATLLATLKRAEWLADFQAKRSELNPSLVGAITPDMAALLAARVRAYVLADDDRVRADLPLLAEMVHIRRELAKRDANPLIIPQWEPSEPRVDDLTGATEEEREELSGVNAYLDGKAAVALAGRNLAAVLPLVQAEAAKLGVVFDAKTPGAREALLLALNAYRTGLRGVTLRDAGEVVATPVVSATVSPKLKARTLRDVFDQWKVSGSKRRSDDSIAAYDRALRQFEGQHHGVNLEAINRELGNAYRTWLRGQSSISSKTQRDRITALKSLLKFAAIELEWIPKHPWMGLDIETITEDPRRAWEDEELATLFAAPLHASYVLPKARNAGREAAYWLPLLGLFTGARLGELCQLRTADVQNVKGIDVLVVTDDGEDQKVKTEAGRRSVPIHSELIRLGFLRYVETIRASESDALWPSLPLREGKPSDYFGRWFREHRTPLGLKPTFHYFRHTVRPLMRRAGFSESTQDKITGHETKGSIGSTVYDHWTLKELQSAVEAIQYPTLRLCVVTPSGLTD
ncbi:MAG: site-specific integrase [Gammaproteobacteria bacterium]|nr:site-specific integrase [Gammaproteobacteria bacterium]MBU1530539.1 site-specific integrase [Gammaproteobacteria bacterium]MBU2285756.1 site-specific integrase [Gammaproteobacteria bacterium]